MPACNSCSNVGRGRIATPEPTSTARLTASTNDAGSYDCVLTNSCGTATSNAVVVTVNTPPTITTQPSSATAFRSPAATGTRG